MRKGKLIVLNGKGHEEITANVQNEAMRKIAQGYMMYQYTDIPKGGIELGDRVTADQITDESQVAALRPMAGG